MRAPGTFCATSATACKTAPATPAGWVPDAVLARGGDHPPARRARSRGRPSQRRLGPVGRGLFGPVAQRAVLLRAEATRRGARCRFQAVFPWLPSSVFPQRPWRRRARLYFLLGSFLRFWSHHSSFPSLDQSPREEAAAGRGSASARPPSCCCAAVRELKSTESVWTTSVAVSTW